ncbi:hypothetical protein [Noviluteimonas gilva]|nr:hypothetical protein [Lysobacter gilvus]
MQATCVPMLSMCAPGAPYTCEAWYPLSRTCDTFAPFCLNP